MRHVVLAQASISANTGFIHFFASVTPKPETLHAHTRTYILLHHTQNKTTSRTIHLQIRQ